MFEQTIAVIRNTFFESVRQPIMLVILVVATVLIIFSNLLSAFTMEDNQKMYVDMGLATIFTCGTLLAAFIATSVLTREIENRTVLTVVSKPISRPVFIIGKFVGVAGAMVLATLYMSFVFLLVEQHTVLQTVRDPIHLPVILFGVGAGLIGLAVGIWCNYFYNMVFASTVICVTTPLAGLAYVLSLMFQPDFASQPISVDFEPQLILGLLALITGLLVLTAIAIAASTRLRQVTTLCVTLAIFLAGMLSDWAIGRPVHSIEDRWLDRAVEAGETERVTVETTIPLVSGEEIDPTFEERDQPTRPLTSYASSSSELLSYRALKLGYAVVPNFQLFILSDALTQKHLIPTQHVVNLMIYGGAHILASLGIAVILFQRREVG